MANTTKGLSERDPDQVLRAAYNISDGSVQTSGFLTGKIGHKVAITITTTSVLNDTQVITFSDTGTTLYVLTLVYSDSSLGTLLSAERTA